VFKSIFKYFFWLLIAVGIATLLVSLKSEYSNSSSASPQVWVKDSMERVMLQDPAENVHDIHLYAARGEYESFQIAIKAKQYDGVVTNVQVSDLNGRENRSISQDNITLYREHYVNVTKLSPSSITNKVKSLGTGWYPDGLIPFVDPQTGVDLANAELDAIPLQLKRGSNQTIWVDIFVPRDTPANDYQGTYTVISDRGTITGNILLTVWDFELPLKPSLQSAFLSWEQNDKNTLIELLKHRIMPAAKINPEDERELIDQWGLTSLRLPYWSGANYQTCTMSPPPSASTIREEGLKHQLDLMLYTYATDEIDHCQGLKETFKAWSKNIHQAGVKHLAVMAPVPEFYDQVDIWTVNPERYNAAGEKITEVLKQGKEIWFYTYFAPMDNSPIWLINFEPINYRIAQGFINQSLGLTGLLYSRVDTWTNDPWNNVDFLDIYSEEPKHYPGEGMLIYPGKQVGISGAAPSMRLKWVREGVEDYEYIEILKRAGYQEWAMKAVGEVAKDMHNWDQDPDILNSVRLKLGTKIHQLSHSI
ncbi:MAG: DUF4091 domain-containing protein, partial [Hydrococcus sp. SU_1_0]|nr:DUF4091 domain-containing protein [Hydrococcus sp. SU_1_0]